MAFSEQRSMGDFNSQGYIYVLNQKALVRFHKYWKLEFSSVSFLYFHSTGKLVLCDCYDRHSSHSTITDILTGETIYKSNESIGRASTLDDRNLIGIKSK